MPVLPASVAVPVSFLVGMAALRVAVVGAARASFPTGSPPGWTMVLMPVRVAVGGIVLLPRRPIRVARGACPVDRALGLQRLPPAFAARTKVVELMARRIPGNTRRVGRQRVRRKVGMLQRILCRDSLRGI